MKVEKWIYMGVMLTDSTKQSLLNVIKDYISIPEGWKIVTHHCTLCYNNGADNNNLAFDKLSNLIGSTAELTITHIGMSREAIAVRVDHELPTTANIPHITITIPRNGKPVESGYIKYWRPIPEFKITGIINVYKPDTNYGK